MANLAMEEPELTTEAQAMFRVGLKVKERREYLRLSQRELAERMNVSAGAISQYETGRYSLDVASLTRIARALNCSVAFLFEDVGTQELPDPRPEVLKRLEVLKPDLRRSITDYIFRESELALSKRERKRAGLTENGEEDVDD